MPVTLSVPVPATPTATTPLVVALVSLVNTPPGADRERARVRRRLTKDDAAHGVGDGGPKRGRAAVVDDADFLEDGVGHVPPVQLLAVPVRRSGGSQRMSNALAVGAPIARDGQGHGRHAVARQSFESTMMHPRKCCCHS